VGRPPRRRLRTAATGAAYATAWAAVRRLPEPLAERAFDLGADAAARRGGRGTSRLRENLATVRPDATPDELDALVRAGMRSYARYWREVFTLGELSGDAVLERVQAPAFHRIEEGHARGRGVILALPHMGNWDLAGAYLARRGYPFTTVAERLEPADLFDRFVAFRSGLGMEVLPLTGHAAPPMGVLEERLRAGGVICLLADRDMSARGVEVSFFGRPATMAAGPAALALRTGATLLPVTCSYPTARTMLAGVHPPLYGHPEAPADATVATLTQAMADAFATGPDGIAAHPEDWHMLARLWAPQPEAVPV
jgi:phosphatidylinositol dimannoside acyltransferase